ncbi:hypothetical protein AVEN_57829-1 [Araneus ventricosus]|uniref:Uncharacterized protein n=1 Tax=Araneus ventricosus TaxID=182803 RepID=A0A4Y2I8F2_ARAVE|nr:hypothetical protein AVEN_57829-1 [Araneus ventricosus]
MSSSSSDRGSKLRGPSQNCPRVASKRDVNIIALVPVLLLLLMSLTVLAPLRGCCGVRGKWTCGTLRAATWYHGSGLVFVTGGHGTKTTLI